MGKPDLFAIVLSNPQAVYFPGQPIEGQVMLNLSEEMKMRGIRLHFYGGARVHWSEQHTSGKRRITKYYTATETYFNSEMVLFGKATGASGDNPTLKAGKYNYPFRFQLPQTIPASYESRIGRIRYMLSCVIDKPWAFDHNVVRAFTVISLVDLNTIPGVLEGGTATDSKTLCCCCCKSGPISCTLKLDRKGYVPGEAIPIRGEIFNQSSRKMTKSFTKLAMVSHYYARGRSKMEYREVSSVRRGPIEPGDSDTWNGDGLLIPPIPPSVLTGCRIIQVKYLVEMCVVPSGLSFDLVVALPVIIGSIPLKVTLQQYGMTASSTPTYGASTFGEIDLYGATGEEEEEESSTPQGTNEPSNYTPQYAYYNWAQPK